IRNHRPGNNDDAVVLTLAIPHGGRWKVVEYWMHAGESGRSSAVVMAGSPGSGRRQEVRGARIVEHAMVDGYSIEAFVPFTTILKSDSLADVKVNLRIHDVDSLAQPKVENEPALVPLAAGSPEQLRSLQVEGHHSSVFASFLREHGVVHLPLRFDLRGNVLGDRGEERVVVVGPFLCVMGPAVQGGRGLLYVRLGVEGPEGVRSVQFMDLTGDGQKEILLTLRQRNERGSRDLLQALHVRDASIEVIWNAEIRKESGGMAVESEVRIEGGGRHGIPVIRLRAREAQGVDRARFEEEAATDAEAMLFPWGAVVERKYQWNGQRIVKIAEVQNPRALAFSTAHQEAREGRPQAPSREELLRQVQQRFGIEAGKQPDRLIRSNCYGGPKEETIVVYGNRLFLVGEEFGDGWGWVYYDASPGEVMEIRVVDLNGDGRGEVVLKVRQSAGELKRELLVVLEVRADGMRVLLKREVARELGAQRVESAVEIGPGRLVISPGKAVGWNAENWPWRGAPQVGDDGVEAILLPWERRTIRYRHVGGSLVAE
ncbi:MAG: hypothetical protein NZM37_04585, partial [Sandaracinaceae bacterium]|nr:hypothetical protein [Sandaracinaceae bacterium]